MAKAALDLSTFCIDLQGRNFKHCQRAIAHALDCAYAIVNDLRMVVLKLPRSEKDSLKTQSTSCNNRSAKYTESIFSSASCVGSFLVSVGSLLS